MIPVALANTAFIMLLAFMFFLLIRYVWNIIDLLVVGHALRRHDPHVFCTPLFSLLGRPFREIASLQYAASLAIQRGEVPDLESEWGSRTFSRARSEHRRRLLRQQQKEEEKKQQKRLLQQAGTTELRSGEGSAQVEDPDPCEPQPPAREGHGDGDDHADNPHHNNMIITGSRSSSTSSGGGAHPRSSVVQREAVSTFFNGFVDATRKETSGSGSGSGAVSSSNTAGASRTPSRHRSPKQQAHTSATRLTPASPTAARTAAPEEVLVPVRERTTHTASRTSYPPTTPPPPTPTNSRGAVVLGLFLPVELSPAREPRVQLREKRLKVELVPLPQEAGVLSASRSPPVRSPADGDGGGGGGGGAGAGAGAAAAGSGNDKKGNSSGGGASGEGGGAAVAVDSASSPATSAPPPPAADDDGALAVEQMRRWLLDGTADSAAAMIVAEAAARVGAEYAAKGRGHRAAYERMADHYVALVQHAIAAHAATARARTMSAAAPPASTTDRALFSLVSTEEPHPPPPPPGVASSLDAPTLSPARRRELRELMLAYLARRAQVVSRSVSDQLRAHALRPRYTSLLLSCELLATRHVAYARAPAGVEWKPLLPLTTSEPLSPRPPGPPPPPPRGPGAPGGAGRYGEDEAFATYGAESDPAGSTHTPGTRTPSLTLPGRQETAAGLGEDDGGGLGFPRVLATTGESGRSARVHRATASTRGSRWWESLVSEPGTGSGHPPPLQASTASTLLTVDSEVELEEVAAASAGPSPAALAAAQEFLAASAMGYHRRRDAFATLGEGSSSLPPPPPQQQQQPWWSTTRSFADDAASTTATGQRRGGSAGTSPRVVRRGGRGHCAAPSTDGGPAGPNVPGGMAALLHLSSGGGAGGGGYEGTWTSGLAPAAPLGLRVAYILGADRGSLLRATTVHATRTFIHGAVSFVCFYTARDERRAARRRVIRQDRRNRRELARAAAPPPPPPPSPPPPTPKQLLSPSRPSPPGQHRSYLLSVSDAVYREAAGAMSSASARSSLRETHPEPMRLSGSGTSRHMGSAGSSRGDSAPVEEGARGLTSALVGVREEEEEEGPPPPTRVRRRRRHTGTFSEHAPAMVRSPTSTDDTSARKEGVGEGKRKRAAEAGAVGGTASGRDSSHAMSDGRATPMDASLVESAENERTFLTAMSDPDVAEPAEGLASTLPAPPPPPPRQEQQPRPEHQEQLRQSPSSLASSRSRRGWPARGAALHTGEPDMSLTIPFSTDAATAEGRTPVQTALAVAVAAVDANLDAAGQRCGAAQVQDGRSSARVEDVLLRLAEPNDDTHAGHGGAEGEQPPSPSPPPAPLERPHEVASLTAVVGLSLPQQTYLQLDPAAPSPRQRRRGPGGGGGGARMPGSRSSVFAGGYDLATDGFDSEDSSVVEDSVISAGSGGAAGWYGSTPGRRRSGGLRPAPSPLALGEEGGAGLAAGRARPPPPLPPPRRSRRKQRSGRLTTPLAPSLREAALAEQNTGPHELEVSELALDALRGRIAAYVSSSSSSSSSSSLSTSSSYSSSSRPSSWSSPSAHSSDSEDRHRGRSRARRHRPAQSSTQRRAARTRGGGRSRRSGGGERYTRAVTSAKRERRYRRHRRQRRQREQRRRARRRARRRVLANPRAADLPLAVALLLFVPPPPWAVGELPFTLAPTSLSNPTTATTMTEAEVYGEGGQDGGVAADGARELRRLAGDRPSCCVALIYGATAVGIATALAHARRDGRLAAEVAELTAPRSPVRTAGASVGARSGSLSAADSTTLGGGRRASPTYPARSSRSLGSDGDEAETAVFRVSTYTPPATPALHPRLYRSGRPPIAEGGRRVEEAGGHVALPFLGESGLDARAPARPPAMTFTPELIVMSDAESDMGVGTGEGGDRSAWSSASARGGGGGGGGARGGGGDSEMNEADDAALVDQQADILRPVMDAQHFPEGLSIPVTLHYVRIGDSLYEVTEVVDRTFIQYREKRLLSAQCGARPDRFEPPDLLDGSTGEDVDNEPEPIANTSFSSFLDAFDDDSPRQKLAAAAADRPRARTRHAAVSTLAFGDLTYSFAGSTQAHGPGSRRQLVHMCWRCLSAEARAIFLPCGHYATCEACAEVLRECCVCKTTVMSIVVLDEEIDEAFMGV